MRRFRLGMVASVGLLVVLLGTLLFGGLNQNLVYFLTPGEARAQRAEFPDGRRLQIGGLVVPGSVATIPNGVRFTVSGTSTGSGPLVRVEHHGAPAQLFAAGIGVLVEGSWRGEQFVSDSMKVKHDENYRPPAPAQPRPQAAGGGS